MLEPPPPDPAASRRPALLALLVPGYGERLGRDLWLLFAARIINALAFTGAFPFLATYLAEERGLASILVGVVYTSQGIVGAAFQGVGGVLAERLGRRPMLVWSLVLRAGLTLGLGLLIHQRAPLLVLTGLILVNSMLAGVFQPAADTLVADLAPPERRTAAFAHQRVAINVGWAIAPALGGFVSDRFSLADAFFAASPMVLVGALVLSRLPVGPPVPVAPREPMLKLLADTVRERALRLHLFGALLTFTLAGQLVVTLSLDAGSRLHLDKRHIGLVWAVNGAMVVFAQMPVARLVGRLGTRASLIVSSAIYGLAYASVGWVHSFGGLVVSMVAITLGELLNTPSQQTAVAARAAPGAIGRTMGMLGLTTMLGRSLGPLVGGAVHDGWGDEPRLMWALLGSLGLVAAMVYAHPRLADHPQER